MSKLVSTRQLAALVLKQSALSPLEAMRPVPMQRDFIVAIAAEALAAREFYESALIYLSVICRTRAAGKTPKPHLSDFLLAVETFKNGRAKFYI